MPNYKEMYFKMFNKLSEVINLLQNIQQDGENRYLQEEHEPNIIIYKKEEKDSN